MRINILQATNYILSQWSGGSTTQLFVYPLTADYATRNFEFRLSTATVEAEKSAFTSLPGFHRKLMILEGEITITHENHYSKLLNPFTVETFEGDWKTSSAGRCTDFNVMTNARWQSNLFAVHLIQNSQQSISITPNTDWYFVYALNSPLRIVLKDQTVSMCSGELLAIEKPNTGLIDVMASTACTIVCVEILKSVT